MMEKNIIDLIAEIRDSIDANRKKMVPDEKMVSAAAAVMRMYIEHGIEGTFVINKYNAYFWPTPENLKGIVYPKEPHSWVSFNNDNPATYPENLRKVWLISEKISLQDELIAYFDGGFYRNTEDWQIDSELLVNVKWCYVQHPPKP